MPVTGAKPKPDGQKRHRVKPVYDWVEVPNTPFAGGPKLPRQQPDGKSWPAATKKWWAVVSAMPHCTLWAPTDWQFALDTAYLVATYHGGELRHAGEVRQREKILGTTADARRDLRIRYVDQQQSEEPASVTSLKDYRAAL